MVRLNLILSVFAQAGRAWVKDPRPGPQDLQAACGALSAAVLSPSYPSERSPETIAKIINAIAKLYKQSARRLARFIAGGDDPRILEFWELQTRVVRCTWEGPHVASDNPDVPDGWLDLPLDADKWKEQQRRCDACYRRTIAPEAVEWEDRLLQRHDLPADIGRAVQALRAAGRAVTYVALSEETRRPLRELRRVIARAKMEKPRKGRKNFERYLIFPFVLASSLSSSAHALHTGKNGQGDVGFLPCPTRRVRGRSRREVDSSIPKGRKRSSERKVSSDRITASSKKSNGAVTAPSRGTPQVSTDGGLVESAGAMP